MDQQTVYCPDISMLRDEMNPIYWKEIFIQILICISYIEKKRCKNQEVTIIKQTSHNEDEK